METSLKTDFAQIFSRCPKNLSCPKFGGAAAPLAPPARTPMTLKEAEPHTELNISLGCYRRISHGWDKVNLLFWIYVCSVCSYAYEWSLEILVLSTFRSIFIYRCLAAVLHACHEWLWFFFSCRGTDHKKGKLFLSTFRKDYGNLAMLRSLCK